MHVAPVMAATHVIDMLVQLNGQKKDNYGRERRTVKRMTRQQTQANPPRESLGEILGLLRGKVGTEWGQNDQAKNKGLQLFSRNPLF